MSSLTPAHKLLLSTFAIRRPLSWLPDDPSFTQEEWQKLLGQYPFDVVQQFLADELLEVSSLADHLMFIFRQTDGYNQLLKVLIEYSLPTNGDEFTIIQRLMFRVEHEILWNLVREIKLVELTNSGTAIVSDYLSELEKTPEKDFIKHFWTTPTKIKIVLSFVAGAAVSGVIGNRVDATLLYLIQQIKPFLRHPNEAVNTGLNIGVHGSALEGIILVPSQNATYSTHQIFFDPISATTITFAVILVKIIDIYRKKLH